MIRYTHAIHLCVLTCTEHWHSLNHTFHMTLRACKTTSYALMHPQNQHNIETCNSADFEVYQYGNTPKHISLAIH